MKKIALWHAAGQGPPARHEVAGPTWLSEAGLRAASQHAPGDLDHRLLLLPASAGRRDCCVVLVPDALARTVSRNHDPLPAGLHRLRHADRLDLAGQTVWVAESRAAEVIEYDPAVHGEDVFCARTKARLVPGARVVRCPDCGLLYTERAWALSIPCHICGHDSKQSEWQPPHTVAQSGGVRELLALVNKPR